MRPFDPGTARHRPTASRSVVATVLGGLLLVLAAGAVAAADRAVAISGFSFSPGTVTIAPGDTVTWTNSDLQAHTATADDDAWDTGTIGNGASATIAFPTAGSFAYHCDIHPEMTGTIVVAAAGATQPTTDTVAAADRAGPSVGAASWAVLMVLASAAALGALAVARRLAGR